MGNITIKVSVSGKAELVAKLQQNMSSIRTQVNEAIQGAGIDTQAAAKKASPVDTGRLRASILYTPGTLSCTVGTNVFYAWYLELGTVKMSARPFLYPAFRLAVKGLKRDLKDISI